MSEKIIGDPAAFAGVSEHSQQVALMAAVAQYADDVSLDDRTRKALEWMHSIPNGGGRGSDKRSAMISGANMKAEGTKTGVSDLHLPVARHGYISFYIEMKKPGEGKWMLKRGEVGAGEGGRVWVSGESEDQIAFGAWAQSEGHLYAVFYNWYSALRAIMWYLGFAHTKAWALPE